MTIHLPTTNNTTLDDLIGVVISLGVIVAVLFVWDVIDRVRATRRRAE